MAGRTAVLAIRIIADSASARREMDQTDRQVSKFGKGMTKLAGPAALALGGVAALGHTALDAASDLQQATGAAQSVFGKYANTVIRSSKGAADAVGLSQAAFLQQSTILGSQLKNLGTPMDQVAGQTDNLIRKASDLAATFGGSTADAVDAVSSLMRGERDPIERYGVSINQAAIDAYEMSQGLGKLTGAAKKHADAQATLALLTKQTAAAQGQFARETHTAAGATEIANAKYENAKAALGKRLLPVYAAFKERLATVANWVSKNSTLVFSLAGGIAGLAAVVLTINGAMRVWSSVTKAYEAVQKGLNLVMEASPMWRIAAIVLAIGAALVIAYQRSATFRAIVQTAFHAVMAVVQPVADFFVHTLPDAFMTVASSLRTAWNAAVGFLKTWGPRALLVLAPFIGIPLLIYRHFGAIVGWLSGVWSAISGGAVRFVNGLVGFILSIPSRLAGLVGSMFHAGVEFIQAFFRGIGHLADAAGSFALSFAKTIVNGIINGLNTLLGLPWDIGFHISMPWGVPDIDFGPYTVVPRIPVWAAAPDVVPGPGDVASLLPGWSLLASAQPSAMTHSWGSARLAAATTPKADAAPVVKVYFQGLVTDPEAVARQLREVVGSSDARNGLSRTRV